MSVNNDERLGWWTKLNENLSGERWFARALVAPAIVTVFLVTIIPMLWSLYISFHSWNPGINPDPTFNGIDNFVWVLSSSRFWHSLANFTYYGVGGVVVQVGLGTVLALALYNHVENTYLEVGLLTVFLLPMMYAPIVAGSIWQMLFLPGGGTVNGLLQLMGLGTYPWLQERWLALTALLIADTWQWVGLPLIIIYSGRASISDQMYEAARTFGASRWLMFRYITLPQIRNLIAIAAILRFMDIYKFFDKLFIMTRGGPGNSTEVPTLFAWKVGLSNFNMGRAAALTWILALGAMGIMYLFWDYMQTTKEV